MKLAWKELIYNKKKYLLIEFIIVLLLFMVLFLSGLANGLARAVSSGIEEMDADYFLISDSSEDLITLSSLDETVLEELKEKNVINAAPLNIQRMYIISEHSDKKLNITYFAIQAGSFLEPDVFEGFSLIDSNAENPILLDDDFQAEGIRIGDKVLDSSTEMEFTVVGFAKDQMYGHTSIGFITIDSYTAIRTTLNPLYTPVYNAVAIKANPKVQISIEGTKLNDKRTIIESIPSYTAEKLTITMIVWVLVIVSAVIIGVFYYILTMQKEKQYAVMKSIGVGMWQIAGVICSQVLMVAGLGVIISNGLTFALSSALPQTMPYYLTGSSAFLVSIAFVFISLFGSLLSVYKVSRVDPMTVVGGEQ